MSFDEFEPRIQHFPSSFQLEIERLNKAAIRNVLERLLRELKDDETTDCNEEIVRKNNLLSFLYWNLEEKTKAFQHNEDARRKDENSILAIANKAIYLQESTEFYSAEQCLIELEKLKSHELYAIFHRKAKAEIAYSYSRFGPRFYEKAEEEFEKVIHENGDNYLWKFGLGLIIQRQIHIYNNPNYFNISHEEKFKKAVYVLWDVVLHTADTNPVLCAKAWVEIGVLMYQKYKSLENELESVNLPKGMEDLKYLDCFEKACKISKNDAFVLERAGKFCRYSGQFEKSEEFLKKAIKLKETSFSHHHLGLTLKKSAFKYKRSKSYPTEHFQASGSISESNPAKSSLETDGFVSTKIQNIDFDRPHNVALLNTDPSLYSVMHNTEARTDDINIALDRLSITNESRSEGNDTESFGRNRGVDKEKDRESFRGSEILNTGIDRESFGGFEIHRRSFRENASRGRGNGREDRGLPCERQKSGTYRGRGRGRGKTGKKFTRSDSYTQQNLARNVINSPKKLSISPNNPKLEEATMHFKKAVSLSHGCNLRAQYHLGLTYAKLGRNKDALEAFKFITSQRRRLGAFNCITPQQSQQNESFTQMELVSAYEQQGLCLQRLSETCPDEEKNNLVFNSKQLFFMAIQTASDAVAVMPSLKSAWNAFPTLRDLLEKKSNKDLKDVEELAKLYELMHEYGKSIAFYEEILSQSTNDSERRKSQYAIAKNFVKLQDFDNAILFLNLLYCTGEGNQIDRQFYLDTYISGALNALQKQEQEKCAERFQNVFRFCCPCQNGEEQEESYDVHIITDDHESFEVIHIERILSCYCQLKVTVNERDVLPGRFKLRSTIASIKSSSCVVSVIHSPELLHQTNYYIENVIIFEKTMVIVNVDGVPAPEYLQKFPKINICRMSKEDIENCNEKWLEQFFRSLGPA
ncbi:hypothetical protein KUTeg_018943 [Tegillarca granosa]|uniref:Uncharacterized protein n=1 Tax=Tegillarca granosa TaxID=220873 RepID=A0ABQ9EG37_TEGGR|nr:hypothetical protein KUTeg_018943 [Tegillarca granosa]